MFFYLVLYLVDNAFFDDILEFGVQGYSSHDDKWNECSGFGISHLNLVQMYKF